jgi:hypothetical protein
MNPRKRLFHDERSCRALIVHPFAAPDHLHDHDADEQEADELRRAEDEDEPARKEDELQPERPRDEEREPDADRADVSPCDAPVARPEVGRPRVVEDDGPKREHPEQNAVVASNPQHATELLRELTERAGQIRCEVREPLAEVEREHKSARGDDDVRDQQQLSKKDALVAGQGRVAPSDD